jgi:hypothetical protein
MIKFYDKCSSIFKFQLIIKCKIITEKGGMCQPQITNFGIEFILCFLFRYLISYVFHLIDETLI